MLAYIFYYIGSAITLPTGAAELLIKRKNKMSKLIQVVRNLPKNITSSAAGGTINVICGAIAAKRIATFYEALTLICLMIESGEINLGSVFRYDHMTEEQSQDAWDDMCDETRQICAAI